MEHKSIRFLARDLGMNIDEARKEVDQLGLVDGNEITEKGRMLGVRPSKESKTPTYGANVALEIRRRKDMDKWTCDRCGLIMNKQNGFSVLSGRWVCTNCGYDNDVSETNYSGRL